MNIQKNSNKYRKAVFVVIYKKQGKKIFYLLLKRKKHWVGWEFTKGGIETKEKETPLFAAKREAFEESGLIPRKIIGFEKSGSYKYKSKLKDRLGFIGQTYKLFAAQVDDNKNKSKIKIDKKEHSDYVWLDFPSSLQTLTHKNQKDCLEIVNKFLNKN